MRKHNVSKKDTNHNDLCEVLLTYWGGGVRDYYNIGWPGHPDILHHTPHGMTLVGKFDHTEVRRALIDVPGIHLMLSGSNIYFELKREGEDLRSDQKDWIVAHYGPVLVARTMQDVINYGAR